MYNGCVMETTIKLLKLVKRGDRQALNDLYARYWERLHVVVRLRLGSALRAKLESSDIVQEAFMVSLKGIEKFEHGSKAGFFHWLCTLVENRIRDQADYFRAQKRQTAREVPLQPRLPSRTTLFVPLADTGASPTPSSVAVRNEELQLLEQAADELPSEQREAVWTRRRGRGKLGSSGRAPSSSGMEPGGRSGNYRRRPAWESVEGAP